MDLAIILTFVSGGVIIILISFVVWQNVKGGKRVEENEEVPRRAGGPRARARQRAAAVQQNQRVLDDDEDEMIDAEKEKMGAKKRAKLEAKAEKKAQREMEERDREEKKKKKEKEEELRKKLEEKEKEEEKRREEEEKREEEERERREHEEYLKLKSAFSVEEEGFDDIDINENANLLQEFITYIQDMKVVTFEDLAAKFHMKTQSVIDRVQDLQKEGRLTGVIDDRGKFIYISQKEMESGGQIYKAKRSSFAGRNSRKQPSSHQPCSKHQSRELTNFPL